AIWLQTLLNEGRHPGTNETVISAKAINKVATGISLTITGRKIPRPGIRARRIVSGFTGDGFYGVGHMPTP
ncbi:hypothetical protein B0H14DRAFT_2337946, partial [Mycena olivaceomarginata]